MEPNNFEKDFREKLNQRTIEPSDKAWDRLDAMLSIAEKKKPKKNKKWLYAAASLIGFLLAGTFFFNENESVIKTHKSIATEENIKKDTVEQPTLNALDSVATGIASVEEKSIQTSDVKKADHNLKPNTILKNESNQVAESSIIIKNYHQKQSITNQSSVIEIQKGETVDQLLISAEKTVVAENSAKLKSKSKVKVNASDLLNQVDGELELSFREKVITQVNKNYQTVKVALANRNQQE